MKHSAKNGLHFEPQWFVIIIFFGAGIFFGVLGLFIWFFNGGELYGLKKIHLAHSTYKFINPLLAVDTVERQAYLSNQKLKTKFEKAIKQAKESGGVQDAAVYFRDLEVGRWAGVNEDAKFSPGLILRIPMMITLFRQAENDSGALARKLVYQENNYHLSVDNNGALNFGESYTIDELIQAMMVNNDVSATNILFDYVDKDLLKEVYSDLGVNYQEDKLNDDFLTVKTYSLFFRVLYNATYLNRMLSEHALEILSRSAKDGMTKNLPNDLMVAHKYRGRQFQSGQAGTLIENHDCGIIYFPGHSYILCMMGIGKSSETINRLFVEFSQLAYQDMVAFYPDPAGIK